MEFALDILEDDLDILWKSLMRDSRGQDQRFRLTKETTLNLFDLIEEELDNTTHRNNSVSPMNRLLIFLRFAATGAFFNLIAESGSVDISTVSRIVKHVASTIATLRPNFIHLPTNLEEAQETKNQFYVIAHFPRVIGSVDCTHIKIQSPGGEDGEVFRNRKGYFSFNVQAISGPDLKIYDVVARWPGSQHDATIYDHSRVCARFENNEFPDSFLLGDSAYALTHYFLTPLPDSATRAEQLYNESHIRTRNTVERLFGLWKRRFPVLALGIRTKLNTTMTVIVATAVLHNIAIMSNDIEPPAPDGVDPDVLQELILQGQIDFDPPVNNNRGINTMRNFLINNYFSQLPANDSQNKRNYCRLM